MLALDDDTLRVDWRISSRSSSSSGNCVEAGPVLGSGGRVALRHSRHPEAAAFTCTDATWHRFVADIKRGSYDFGA